MAVSSDEAQYFPNRNSSTKTGTFAPTLTFRTRSFRTTFPANSWFALLSSASRAGGVPLLILKLRDEPGCHWVSGTTPHLLWDLESRREAKVSSRRSTRTQP